ncbi:MAG: hypothetical protein RMJ19_06245, partial [Gemmatales bacterium]|nr:hypothetical protein [Gemmatales bacterium]MDW8175254.1 hypothetical protein [Gemmatales bacterium]
MRPIKHDTHDPDLGCSGSFTLSPTRKHLFSTPFCLIQAATAELAEVNRLKKRQLPELVLEEFPSQNRGYSLVVLARFGTR